MTAHLKAAALITQSVFQRLATLVLLLSALGLSTATLAAAAGLVPWLEVTAGLGSIPLPHAGQSAQIGLTVLAILLCFFLPTNARIMALETSHRRFAIGMQDVARAYHAAHATDRAGLFQMSSEFDAVRERLIWLRDHPDLGKLEPGILDVAAQMSHISRDLADIYSDAKVARARTFLAERQQEVEMFNTRIDQAKQISRELQHWAQEVELEESVAASQLQRLRDALREVLPELGFEAMVQRDGTVITLTPKVAE